MSWLEGATITWGGNSAYLSVFYAMLFFRRRTERDVLSFSFIAFALFVHSVGTVLLYRAHSLDEGSHAQALQIAGVVLGVGLLVDFADSTCGRPMNAWRKAAYAYSLVGILVTACGLFTQSKDTRAFQPWGFSGAPILLIRNLSVAGWSMALLALVFVAYIVATLLKHLKENVQARFVLFCVGLATLAAFNDFLIAATSFRSWPLVPHAGFVVGVIMSGTLINRFVHLREELHTKTSELVASYDRVKQASAELEHKQQLATVGELSAVIAHEVRNPLAIIKNATSSLRRQQIRNADRDILLGILDEESDRLNRLVNELLTFASPVVPRGRAIKVRDIVQHTLDLAQKAHENEGVKVRFEVELDEGPDTIACDPDLLQQAFVNIAENAVQAMPHGGSLRVTSTRTTLRDRPAAAIRFKDSGEGMDLDTKAKAKDPFFTTRPTGTGLGLAIVERIMRAHNGEFLIESAKGSGTTVTLTIPTERESVVPDFSRDPELSSLRP